MNRILLAYSVETPPMGRPLRVVAKWRETSSRMILDEVHLPGTSGRVVEWIPDYRTLTETIVFDTRAEVDAWICAHEHPATA